MPTTETTPESPTPIGSADPRFIPSGIQPLDARTGGLEAGGTYLVIGAPGPEKMVATLQFVHAGLMNGDRSLLLTNTDVDDILEVASAWGFDMWKPWRDGLLQVVGFKDDFELRAIRSIEPEEVIEELALVAWPDLRRIAVDPGSLFLTGGARTLLGSTFLAWARDQEATVLVTYSVDGGAASLPSSSEWLTLATTGRLLVERRNDGLRQITYSPSSPEVGHSEQAISLELRPGRGLIQPDRSLARRDVDRGAIDENRLLLVFIGDAPTRDLESWASRAFNADVVTEPFDAIARVQAERAYGGVLVHAPRKGVRLAVQACRAIRPLSRAAIVVASDEAIRSTDRIQLLEAGADDCLSGGLDFRELGLRIRQAIAAGARQMVGVAGGVGDAVIPPESNGGLVPRPVFVREIERRAVGGADLAFFCVLDLSASGLTVDAMEAVLANEVRAEDGDLISRSGNHCIVLLQGAREGQLGPFLHRLRARLEGQSRADGNSQVDIGVLSHPADADRIRALLKASSERAG